MPVDIAAEVTANIQLAHDYNVVVFAAPEIARSARPGQFVMIKTSPGLDPLLRRPFSIFEHTRDSSGLVTGLSIMNKRVGVGTAQLNDVRVGDRLSILGPLGQPFTHAVPSAEAWMVAGGVGLAPFASLAEQLTVTGTKTTLFYGGRSTGDIYYESLFTSLGVRVVVTTEDGSKGERGRVTIPLARELAAAGHQQVAIYACGPTPMMRAVAALGAAAGVSVQVSLEPVMGCGMGGCYSCVVPVQQADGSAHFVRSCLEGPVFDASLLVWDRMTGGH